jgi:hypothetical protein
MLNPFFLQGSKSEQNLVQDLINEHLRMYGVEVYYLPRKYVNEKTIIKEVIESKFDSAYPLEAYVENYDGYGNNPTILSKFGIQALNELTITISRERYQTYIAPLIKGQDNIKLYSRPKEGDLIYFPLGDRLFEIKYVEHEKPFYQLQGTYTYELRCELFRYEDEIINTGVDEIDDTLEPSPADENNQNSIIIGALQKLTLVGTASSATAVTGIVNGGIRFISITNRGGGYLTPPRVAISSAPSTGKTGIATAELISGIVVCNDNINPNRKSVQTVYLSNPGFGYTVAPSVVFVGGGGSGARATATIGDGVVGIVTVTNGGSGYLSSPSVRFENEVFLPGVSTASATATALVSTAGTITAIRITNAGLGYSVAPTITINNVGVGSTSYGTFVFNEIITGSTSGVTAVVRSWNSITNELIISNVTGSFVSGERVTGSKSGASRVVRFIDTMATNDRYADNDNIEETADSIIDFSETNPFGMP